MSEQRIEMVGASDMPEPVVSANASDALVFFGATGDLANKKIFPALYAMSKRGTLHVPVIGVASSGLGIDQLRSRAPPRRRAERRRHPLHP